MPPGPAEIAAATLALPEDDSLRTPGAVELARAYLLLHEAVRAHKRARYGDRPVIGGTFAVDAALYRAAGLDGFRL